MISPSEWLKIEREARKYGNRTRKWPIGKDYEIVEIDDKKKTRIAHGLGLPPDYIMIQPIETRAGVGWPVAWRHYQAPDSQYVYPVATAKGKFVVVIARITGG